jgi:flagellar hook-length control protein FliK
MPAMAAAPERRLAAAHPQHPVTQNMAAEAPVPLPVGEDATPDAPGLVDTGSSLRAPAASGFAADPVPRGVPQAMAQSVVRQVADALPTMTDATLEITLHPEELGRLKLTLLTGEGAPMLHVAAERGDTLELVRRHIELLAREFAAQGFAGLNVSVDQDQRPAQPSGHLSDASAAADTGGQYQTDPARTRGDMTRAQGDGLDIRL